MPKDRGLTNLPHGGDRTSHPPVLGGPMFTRRRIFVGGVASVICAPAIVRAESLMPIRALIVPMQPVHAGFIERLRFHWMEQALKNGWTTERARTFGGISEKSNPPRLVTLVIWTSSDHS
jgi:hypothetical protein